MTLKVKCWHFLTPSHYTNSQNSMISFDYSWFLAKNLSNFVSLPWKFHNWYCHNLNRYGNSGCGVSRLRIQNPIDFCLKVKCTKGFFDIFWSGMTASLQNLCQFLQNKHFQTLFIWKLPIRNRNFNLSKRNLQILHLFHDFLGACKSKS